LNIFDLTAEGQKCTFAFGLDFFSQAFLLAVEKGVIIKVVQGIFILKIALPFLL